MNTIKFASYAGLVALFGLVDAVAQVRVSQLPNFECDRFRCSESTAVSAPRGNEFFAANPAPVTAGPPAGQRLMWQGAAFPACQSVVGFTSTNPYSYVQALNIPVPLGSTHASIDGVVQANLRGGPGGTAGIVGRIQIKRSTAVVWENAFSSYAYTINGSADTPNLFGNAAYLTLEDLAVLANGIGVPAEIDIRLSFFPVFLGGFVPTSAAVCQGKMTIAF